MSRGCGCHGLPRSTPFCVLLPPVTLRRNTSSTESFAASTGRKLAREKSSPAGSNLPGKFLPGGGKIEAIVTIIKLDVIGIIIIISIAISTAPLRSVVTSKVESCIVLRENSPGVDYYLWLMLVGGTIELGFMSKLLSIIILIRPFWITISIL